MKKLLMIFAVVLMASPAAAQLIITGVFDGPLSGGIPKFIEFYACDDIADLSVYGFGSANNGLGTNGVEFPFPADVVAAGTTFYVASEAVSFPTYFGFAAEYVSAAANINGDDAIELFYVGGVTPVVIDIFGDINVDGTGTGWDHLDGWAKRISGTGPDGDVFQITSWNFSGINATDGCMTNASCASMFPLGGFTCNPAVDTRDASWGAMKALFR
jgi:hypothetical protein